MNNFESLGKIKKWTISNYFWSDKELYYYCIELVNSPCYRPYRRYIVYCIVSPHHLPYVLTVKRKQALPSLSAILGGWKCYQTMRPDTSSKSGFNLNVTKLKFMEFNLLFTCALIIQIELFPHIMSITIKYIMICLICLPENSVYDSYCFLMLRLHAINTLTHSHMK